MKRIVAIFTRSYKQVSFQALPQYCFLSRYVYESNILTIKYQINVCTIKKNSSSGFFLITFSLINKKKILFIEKKSNVVIII